MRCAASRTVQGTSWSGPIETTSLARPAASRALDVVCRTRRLILDLAMPGMTGLELQRELTARRQEIPIVFITAHGDETTRRRVLRDGAVECLSKPFSETAVLAAVHAALLTS